jgi:hypothetical protein
MPLLQNAGSPWAYSMQPILLGKGLGKELKCAAAVAHGRDVRKTCIGRPPTDGWDEAGVGLLMVPSAGDVSDR